MCLKTAAGSRFGYVEGGGMTSWRKGPGVGCFQQELKKFRDRYAHWDVICVRMTMWGLLRAATALQCPCHSETLPSKEGWVAEGWDALTQNSTDLGVRGPSPCHSKVCSHSLCSWCRKGNLRGQHGRAPELRWRRCPSKATRPLPKIKFYYPKSLPVF